MDDLERLFRELVSIIKEGEPGRLHNPFQISELYQKIIPYRSYKTRLGFDSSEDYDMAILRMLAGERGYASVEPEEVMQQLALEAEAINPTPGFYREFAAARVTLNASAVGRRPDDQRAYAPPEEPVVPAAEVHPAPEAPEADPRKLVFEPVDATPSLPPIAPEPEPAPVCRGCSQPLPPHRQLLFCPFCGVQLGPLACPNCSDEIEVGWLFCGTCGRPAPGT